MFMAIPKGGIHGDLKKFVDMLNGFQKQDMDCLVPITSEKGFGKTTVSLQIARDYCHRYLKMSDSVFKKNLPRIVGFDNDQILQLIEEAPEYWPIIGDEAVRFAMAEDWGTQESRKTKKQFTQIRTKHLLVFLNILDFWWLDRKYRESMCQFWIQSIQRGYGVVFTKDLHIGIEDRWHRKEFQRITKPYSYLTDNTEIIKAYERHPCYFGNIKVHKLDDEIYGEYLQLRNMNVWKPKEVSTTKNYEMKSIIYNLYQFLKSDEGKKTILNSSMRQEDFVRLFMVDPLTNKSLYEKAESARHQLNTWVGEIRNSIELQQRHDNSLGIVKGTSNFISNIRE
jgi:hypothetical protein